MFGHFVTVPRIRTVNHCGREWTKQTRGLDPETTRLPFQRAVMISHNQPRSASLSTPSLPPLHTHTITSAYLHGQDYKVQFLSD